MNIQEAKAAVERMEGSLSAQPYVVAHSFERNGRRLYLALTDRLRKACKKGRIWKTKAFFTAFKNAEYGFELERAQSPGGADGIFILRRYTGVGGL